MHQRALLFSAILTAAGAQQVGTLTEETHPSLSWQKCTSEGSCTVQNASVVIDANWRWTHSVSDSTNCYTGNTWDATLCPDDVTCATNCALDGADYESTYGITTDGDALTLQFVTGSNVGSRLYLMDTEDKGYQTFDLLDAEFTFDVDVSNLPCGLNGALYFTAMDSDGGTARYPANKAGAKYGTGYCDSQCPRDMKFIDGQANVDGWVPSSDDANTGVGNHGSCCPEMDIWEANKISNALTPHPCDSSEQTMCEGDACGGTYSANRYAGTCDPDGCDFNPYRMGNTSFFGPGKTIDTASKMTVVTQFITGSSGNLTEIKRYYVQGDNVIANSNSDVSGVSGNSITSDFCTAQKKAFGDTDEFAAHGGMSGMGDAMSAMVLILSLWDDYYSSMEWLDSNYPENATVTEPGVARGTCASAVGDPSTVESKYGSSSVTFSNIKFGPINSTFSATA
ncbi:1,4-beta-D-glucan cellobiohydrolase A precursor cbhA [Aspergillus heteromorphus CBS 117.55]|uniref:Glucanase n=1 Tax=Aspergillus heteromorphus CBS 117.55 TaxID=1448321 RepID=A0A317X141_9EURO|nr:1,4-beta-D-glucan cellobiohydrolase A precursor cbhA [Aspergillus heteromorphus CBS 117.55]PWY91257.1 1,4-beta-D-glucan cellobiohydrolase A precursor cbhA [Aspergillus heteromorphus CBS 117.55]